MWSCAEYLLAEDPQEAVGAAAEAGVQLSRCHHQDVRRPQLLPSAPCLQPSHRPPTGHQGESGMCCESSVSCVVTLPSGVAVNCVW